MKGRDGTLTARWSSGRVLVPMVLAAALPLAGGLWVLDRAIENERLAMRQRLVDAYEPRLEQLETNLYEQWHERADQLAFQPDDASPARVFAKAIASGQLDSALVFGPNGALLYPGHGGLGVAQPVASAELPRAEALEFVFEEPQEAAAAYRKLAESAASTERVRALRGLARCLAKTGRINEAVEVLEALMAPELADIRAGRGGLAGIDAGLFALDLLRNGKDKRHARIVSRVGELLADYERDLPAAQRLFGMSETVRLAPGTSFPTLGAEQLAARLIDLPRPKPSLLGPTGLAGFRLLPGRDGRVVGIVADARVAEQSRRWLAESATADIEVRLLPPGQDPAEAPLLERPATRFLAGWRFAALLPGESPFVMEATARMTRYVSVAVVVLLLVAAATFFAARYVSRQLRVARLENDLASTVSHELKTPLTAMSALTETLLRDRCRSEEHKREYLELIARENDRLRQLVDAFLTHGRLRDGKQTLNIETVHVEPIVQSAVAVVRQRFVEPDRLRVEVDPALPQLRADRLALGTVLVNLLDNAHKYSTSPREVWLRVRHDESVLFEVADNGIGLSRRDARRVFDRYYQADRSLARRGEGCGLGLAIVKAIVDAHGGKVEVDSVRGRGSSFRVRIPGTAEDAVGAPGAEVIR